NPVRDECASDAGRSRPNDSRVMRTNFGDTTAEIFREHSDSPVINGVQLTPPTIANSFNKESDYAVIDVSVKSVATSADATSRPGILNPTEEEELYLDTINKIPGLRKILCLIYADSDLYGQILSMNNFIKNSNIGDTGKLDYFKTIDKVSVSLNEICENHEIPEDNRIYLKNLALHYSSSLFEKKLWDKFTSSEGDYANIEPDYATIEGEGGDDIRTENNYEIMYEIMERINQSVGEPIYMNISPTKSESERIDQAEKDDKPVEVKENDYENQSVGELIYMNISPIKSESERIDQAEKDDKPVEVKENDYEITARINQSVGDDKAIEMEKNNPGVNTPYMLMGKDDKENIDPRQESDLADSTYMTMTRKNFFGTNSTAEKEVIRESTNPLMLTV
ncbi:MAG: hypothetical protein WAL30_06455, partial [Candidatus Aquirickettsiella sp.]